MFVDYRMIRANLFLIFTFTAILDSMARFFLNGVQNVFAFRTELHVY
jgi:hypothetical protein